MKKFLKSVLSAICILAILYWVFISMMPQTVSKNENLSDFSTNRAFKIVSKIAEKPHFIGSEDHNAVANYLVAELQKLGLQTEFQEGFSLPDWRNLTKPKNIITIIKGSDPKFSGNKALLLLAHYDSAPHSASHGASDDGSGVATILEGVRAFLHNKTPHKNDIIILFTDAEELGLNGAALFVSQHKWVKNIGLAINFEARGSAGPSYMLMEVNKGNEVLIKDFVKANPEYPVSNSLMYSIYKMLPNDTDLTVFREVGKIQGFNFAFIGNHFNYHTSQDDAAHLDLKTLQHQGTYLMPLLQYFSNSDLRNLNSKNDFVYFNTPFNFIYYPFDWVLPIWFLTFLIFTGLVFFGLAKKSLKGSEILKGFIPLFCSILIAGLMSFFGWKAILQIYPKYKDILHGFTYNGQDYVAVFVCLSISICFYVYENYSTKKQTINHFIAAIFLWLLLNFVIVVKLKGAGFMIFPVLFSLLILAYYIITEKTNWLLNILVAIPTMIIYAPFISMFPIGLGLKIMFVSSILVVLTFTLLLPIFGSFYKKRWWSILFILVSAWFFIKAHSHSGFDKDKAKPNSLLYILDADKNKAVWTTYDKSLDQWTKIYLGENPKTATDLNTNKLFSKYKSEFTFQSNAPLIKISKPIVTFEKDSISENRRFLKIKITPTRKVNRYDIFGEENLDIAHFQANGCKPLNQKGIKLDRNGRKIISYYVVDNIPLDLEFSIDASKTLNLDLMESSFDLMNNPLFLMKKRPDWMMPMPFVLNDAVVIKQKIVPTIILENENSKR
jgi:Peptidase family M28